jgi:hypothetical protein
MKFRTAGDSGDDPRAGALSTLYTCYQLVCPDDPVRTLRVDDQFQPRRITIRQARWLCAPVASN